MTMNIYKIHVRQMLGEELYYVAATSFDGAVAALLKTYSGADNSDVIQPDAVQAIAILGRSTATYPTFILAAQDWDAVALGPEPAVDIATAMTGDTMLCIDCGQPFKSLKRHIRTTHGLTPEEYRERWKLPVDYPMVAPNYSAVRSQLAKDNGLGTR